MSLTSLTPSLQRRSDPGIVVVGFSWDGSDERKMRASFDFGRAGFGRFVDLSAVAEGLGYDQVGLATLTHRVLGAALPKLRSVRPWRYFPAVYKKKLTDKSPTITEDGSECMAGHTRHPLSRLATCRAGLGAGFLSWLGRHARAAANHRAGSARPHVPASASVIRKRWCKAR